MSMHQMDVRRRRQRANRTPLHTLEPPGRRRPTARAGCLLLPLAALLTGCAATRPPADDGWTSLFDGKTLSGWVVKCAPGDENRGFWKVEDGTILADSMGSREHDYIWLMTEKEYADFTLRLKFQAYRDSPGNSGVQIRSRYDAKDYWLDGPQVDIHPPAPWRTGMLWSETRGARRWLCPDAPSAGAVNESMAPGGLQFFFAEQNPGWNDMEISAVGPRVRVKLNGLLVTDYDGTGILDNEAHRKHNVGMRGHVALQLHKKDELRLRFKDVFIRETASGK